MLIAIGLDDAAALAVLSSRAHVVWALKAGGTLEDRPRYNKSLCFDPFPFPDLTPDQATRLRSLGEQLDAHRKAQQARHPKLTLTAMYNVLEKLRAGQPIEGPERQVYDAGLIGILKKLHDDIDAEVAAAYGWPADLSEAELLQRLVDLNRARAAEEAAGHVRWLRPAYQNPTGAAVVADTQTTADLTFTGPGKRPWPKTMQDQMKAVLDALVEAGDATPEAIARQFQGVRAPTIRQHLDTLRTIGVAGGAGNTFVAASV